MRKEIIKMIKCPNCGSTAQVCIEDHETFVWKDTLSIYLTYKCGCGCKFSTKTEVDRNNEKLYEINLKKGVDKLNPL